MKEQIQTLIKKYEEEQRGFYSLINQHEERGLENLDSEEIEYYGAYVGKWEKISEVIADLKELIS